MHHLCPAALMLAAVSGLSAAQTPSHALQTQNVILVMTDGLRWQEVFRGADERLMTKELGGVADAAPLKASYWRERVEERRELLMPFLWNTLAREGQLYGNREAGSEARVLNGKNFSYPGYSETLCGFADGRIDSNDKKPNPNVNVLEWLERKPAYKGRVAAFATWDCLDWILNEERSGVPVCAGFEPVSFGKRNPAIDLVDRLKVEVPRPWADNCLDAFTFHEAREWLPLNQPRVLYLMFGETDEWAHAGDYAAYLRSARQFDAYLRELWEFAQSIEPYKGKTTLIVTCDHGRGEAASLAEWTSHGENIRGAEDIWIGVLGPDTPPLGELKQCAPVTQSQIAATLAAALGEDYASFAPSAGKPMAEALR